MRYHDPVRAGVGTVVFLSADASASVGRGVFDLIRVKRRGVVQCGESHESFLCGRCDIVSLNGSG